MSAQHTPGPWKLETVPTSIGSCHKIGPFPSAGTRSETYACVYADSFRMGFDDALPGAQELLANARLIAAAPDLLRELIILRDQIHQFAVKHGEADFYTGGATEAINNALGSPA